MVTSPDGDGLVPVKLEVIYEDIYELGMLHCTLDEVSIILSRRYHIDLPKVTFHDFLERDKKAAAAFEEGKAAKCESLRRAQLKVAEGGNATMLIWMGKQLLGQKDHADTQAAMPDVNIHLYPEDKDL